MKCKVNQLSVNGICERFDTPCIKKACRFFQPPMTRADRIRSMSDEELAAFWSDLYDDFCPNKPECGQYLDEGKDIPAEWCVACALNWLSQPAEEVQSNA